MQDVSLRSKEIGQIRLSLRFLPALLAGLSQLLRPLHEFSSIRCLSARRGQPPSVDMAGGVGARMNWEIGIDVCVLPCVKQIARGNLLYSTGSSASCSVVT